MLEVAGSIGLIAPHATGIAPLPTPAAAGGLALTMVGAALLHLTRGEFAEMIPSLVLLVMCLFVARGRLKVHRLRSGG